MSRIIDEIINNPHLLEDLGNKPNYNLIKIQTMTGSKYLGYIKDCDDEGIWFEPLFDDFYPAYIFKKDIKKIIIPTNPEDERKALEKERSWFTCEE